MMSGRRASRTPSCGSCISEAAPAAHPVLKALCLKQAGLVLSVLLLLSGCNLGYYSQAISGHFEIQRKAQPISRLLEDGNTPAPLKQQLDGFVAMRRFAHAKLLLPDQGSYQSYADLGRAQVTWMLIAVPEFSLKPKRWCFPFVGCLPYQGFFQEVDAKVEAKALEAQGMDVKLAGSPAYSSLGWFKDPLLNTMLRKKDVHLAETLFHELAHQKIYFKHDTDFNEAFASALAQHGVELWLKEQNRGQDLLEYRQGMQRSDDFRHLTQKTRARLEALYAGKDVEEQMRTRKATIFQDMKAEYQELKKSWDGYSGYDGFMAQNLNNAHLALVSTYQQLVPDFLRLLERHQGDLPAFYAQVASWKDLTPEQRRKRLDSQD